MSRPAPAASRTASAIWPTTSALSSAPPRRPTPAVRVVARIAWRLALRHNTIPGTVATSIDAASAAVIDDVLERVGTALADPTRRRLLLLLLDGGAYPADLASALGAGRSNISNHLACLRGCGRVRASREGRQVRYELSSDRLAHALVDLVELDLEVDTGHDDLDGRGRAD